jgi:Flp pilus assembly protein TadB
MTAGIFVLGHGLLAAAAVVALIVTLAALDWISERDRHNKEQGR